MDIENATTTQARPDLALAAKESQVVMGGYCFPKLFPAIVQPEKGGQFSYAPVGTTAKRNATKGRANSTALDSEEIVSKIHKWATDRIEKRVKIFFNEVKGLGGLASADSHGGIHAVRQTFNAMEYEAFQKVFSTARVAGATLLADGKVTKTLAKALVGARRFGKGYLVLTTNGLLDFLQIPAVMRKISNLLGPVDPMELLAGDRNVLVSRISPILGFGGMIVFDSEIIKDTTFDKYVAVVGLREEIVNDASNIQMVAKEKAIYGYSVVYLPDGATSEVPFEVSSHADHKDKANYYDTDGEYQFNELHGDDGEATPNPNGGAVQVFKMDDIENYTVFQGAPIDVNVKSMPTATPPVTP